MKRRTQGSLAAPGRRRMLKQTAVLGVAAAAAPYVIRSAHAQAAADVAAYTQSKINWRQAEGEEIAV
ncbi:MAG TPA: twin-arginine translocation signal domain-containing protein, partial [Casimicrobiaceae bacterium]|nr:twin-arginine translocation signal domain-containing protein [Casimicrobiaceae bacterium]